MPAVRDRIEMAWGARCFDHAGASEVGSFAYPCATDGGLHLFEDEFICEVLDPGDGRAGGRRARRASSSMTALGRIGLPGDPLPHRRHDRALVGPPAPTAHAGHVAAAGHPRPRRRHGRDPRDERVPVGDRGDPAPVERRRRVLDHVLQRPARDGRGQGRGRARAGARGARDPGPAAPDARAARPHRADQARDPADVHAARRGASRTCDRSRCTRGAA